MLACNEPTQLSQYDFWAACASLEETFSEVIPRLRFRISLPLIKYCRTIFRLNEAIEVDLYPEDGLWICESALLTSLSSGDTPERAVYCFCEDFAVLWDEFAKAPDESLAPDAQQLKSRLVSVVRAVEKEQ